MQTSGVDPSMRTTVALDDINIAARKSEKDQEEQQLQHDEYATDTDDSSSAQALVKEKKERLKQNTKILLITTIAFTIFVIAEIIGALVSNSISLLGDAFAMSVDVFTYLSNIYAERMKSRSVDGKSLDLRTRIIIEVIVPIFSAAALLAISTYTITAALDIIVNYNKDEEEDGKSVKIAFLYGFATANMGIDLLSMFLFYSRGWATFYDAAIHDDEEDEDGNKIKDKNERDDKELDNDNDNDDNDDDEIELGEKDAECELKKMKRLKSQGDQLRNSSRNDEHENLVRERKSYSKSSTKNKNKSKNNNVNMMSALIHVGCDTLRTISVFVAAIVSSSTDIPGTLCDAWAAVIVTLTIFLMLFPLINEIYKATIRIRKVVKKEQELKEIKDKETISPPN